MDGKIDFGYIIGYYQAKIAHDYGLDSNEEKHLGRTLSEFVGRIIEQFEDHADPPEHPEPPEPEGEWL